MIHIVREGVSPANLTTAADQLAVAATGEPMSRIAWADGRLRRMAERREGAEDVAFADIGPESGLEPPDRRDNIGVDTGAAAEPVE